MVIPSGISIESEDNTVFILTHTVSLLGGGGSGFEGRGDPAEAEGC